MEYLVEMGVDIRRRNRGESQSNNTAPSPKIQIACCYLNLNIRP
jgi:hypothetical protein